MNEDKSAVFQQENVDIVVDLLRNGAFQQVIKEFNQARFDLPTQYHWDADSGYGDEYDQKLAELNDELITECQTSFGLSEDMANMVLAQVRRISDAFNWAKYDSMVSDSAADILRAGGLYYKEVEQQVDSKTYWESYFEQYPELKPSKVVYYEGGDPTAALMKWREEQGLTKKAGDIGIDYRPRASGVEREMSGTAKRFRTIAFEMLREELE